MLVVLSSQSGPCVSQARLATDAVVNGAGPLLQLHSAGSCSSAQIFTAWALDGRFLLTSELPTLPADEKIQQAITVGKTVDVSCVASRRDWPRIR